MKDVIISLLEISKHLEEAELGEFDFDKLRDALLKFEQKAPEILQMRKDYRILSNHLTMSVISKARAVRSAENRNPGFFSEEEIFNSCRLTPSRLIEIDNQLKDELNRLLSTRPHFQRTVSAGAGSQPR
ncbi:MAG: hypothetical protein GWN61_07800 [candidate division Zixibacteria bacterium]|nr:hypothetical protein [candidate division Zixibacteria bacterium]NIR63999.1 hypothetical protein [candidate division Zixibacteria bacterium]NIS15285.1 hypothetical protein [candidate division Zixibacteria bacterium]NIS45912.1 hypothetical protein [candidate division Zixibacteria bacterium]NIU14049.1 hypothetical protein [candidate division Zixibacteria bacterium]